MGGSRRGVPSPEGCLPNAWERNMETINSSTAARPRAEIDPPREEALT